MVASTSIFPSYLVTPKELSDSLNKDSNESSSIIPLCVSWFLPNDPEKRTGRQVFTQSHVPGARFLDIDEVKDATSPYPHMLPNATDFSRAMSQLGIAKDDTVVVYDSKELGIFSAPRGAWMLRVFGHENVHILNNFKVWVEQGYPTESGEPEPPKQTQYEASITEPKSVVGFEAVESMARGEASGELANALLIDARPYGRWAGSSPEPRPGMPSGHVPGSVSVPFSEVLDPKTRTILPSAKLARIFKEREIDLDQPIISSCGTGVTAAVIDAALAEAAPDSKASRYVYDGSWTEYAQRADPKLIVKSD